MSTAKRKSYVAADTLGAQVAAQETLIELLQRGVRVEDAGAEPPSKPLGGDPAEPRDDSDRDIHDGSEQ